MVYAHGEFDIVVDTTGTAPSECAIVNALDAVPFPKAFDRLSGRRRGLARYRSGMATRWTLGCDAADPHGLAAFWAGALGYVAEPGYEDPDGASIIDPDGVGPAIGFLRVPDGKTAKNRVHIDIRVAGGPPWDLAEREKLIRAKAAELTSAGATTVREVSHGEQLDHIVLLDPEGNEFCVA
jgi:hypothetical protein